VKLTVNISRYTVHFLPLLRLVPTLSSLYTDHRRYFFNHIILRNTYLTYTTFIHDKYCYKKQRILYVLYLKEPWLGVLIINNSWRIIEHKHINMFSVNMILENGCMYVCNSTRRCTKIYLTTSLPQAHWTFSSKVAATSMSMLDPPRISNTNNLSCYYPLTL
jgi:hypothetical protein